MTELSNRNRFIEDVGKRWMAKEPESGFGVAYVDLNGLKISATITKATRRAIGCSSWRAIFSKKRFPMPLVCRMGGDSFLAVALDLRQSNSSSRLPKRVAKLAAQACSMAMGVHYAHSVLGGRCSALGR